MAGAQPSHHSTLERSLDGSGDADSVRSGKALAIGAALAARGFGYSPSLVAAAATGVSQARQIRAPAGPTTALAPQNGHSPRSSSENQERASTSGGSRLTLPRLGHRFSPGIGRKTYPTLSRVLLKLKRGRRPCCVFVVSVRPPTVACRRGAERRRIGGRVP
jgi:hypothetical protein